MSELRVTICKNKKSLESLLEQGFSYKVNDGFAVIILDRSNKGTKELHLELKKLGILECLFVYDYSFIDRYSDLVMYYDLVNDTDTILTEKNDYSRAKMIGFAKIGAGDKDTDVLKGIWETECILTEEVKTQRTEEYKLKKIQEEEKEKEEYTQWMERFVKANKEEDVVDNKYFKKFIKENHSNLIHDVYSTL
jgi:hypothetical protein